MRNLINKYILLLALAFTATACNDSFLERTPTNNLNANEYWKTISDLEAYTNGIYNEAGDNANYKFMVGFSHAAWNSRTQSIFPLEAMSDNYASLDGSHIWASAVAAGIENVPSNKT